MTFLQTSITQFPSKIYLLYSHEVVLKYHFFLLPTFSLSNVMKRFSRNIIFSWLQQIVHVKTFLSPSEDVMKQKERHEKLEIFSRFSMFT